MQLFDSETQGGAALPAVGNVPVNESEGRSIVHGGHGSGPHNVDRVPMDGGKGVGIHRGKASQGGDAIAQGGVACRAFARAHFASRWRYSQINPMMGSSSGM